MEYFEKSLITGVLVIKSHNAWRPPYFTRRNNNVALHGMT